MFALERVGSNWCSRFRRTACMGATSSAQRPGKDATRELELMMEIENSLLEHGPNYARRLRRKAPAKDDIWHLDEVVVRHQRSEMLAVASSRSRGLCARRDRPDAPQHQGCQALADAASEEPGHRAKADHRQIALLRGGKTPGHAERGTPIAQRIEQPSREFPPSVPKTRADATGAVAYRLA